MHKNTRQHHFVPPESKQPCFSCIARQTSGIKRLHEQIRTQQPSAYQEQFSQDLTDERGSIVLPQQEYVRRWPLMYGRYRFLSRLAEGGFSQLILAEDTAMQQSKRPRNVAIKIMNAKHAQIGQHEYSKLRKLNLKDNCDTTHILRVYSSFYFQNHFCLVFELLGESLLSHLHKYPPYTMPIHELKKIIVQLLAALCFLHTNRIAHADLKPENLLLAKESLQCKIVDFGNAIDMSKNEQQAYYKDFNVQTLYYRAPEVVFGLPFDTSIDMWSLGCIIYEIYTGDVLFKSRNCTELVQQMFGILGNVPSELYSRGKFYKDYECFKVEKPKQSKTNLHDRTFVTLCQKMRVHDANFVQFIQGLLEYDPVKRMTPQQALLHPFIAKMFPFAIAFPNTNIVQPTVSAVSSPIVTNKRPFDMVDKRQDLTPPRKLQIIESRTHTASAIRSTFYQK